MDKLSTQEILDARLDDWRKLAHGLHARYGSRISRPPWRLPLPSRRLPRPKATSRISR